jgi:hypothetical protein
MSAVDRQYGYLLRLLFDGAAREQLGSDPEGALLEAGLTGADADPFRGLDLAGLAIDAAGRRRYLMSALCRSYPLTAAALGAAAGGAERLAAFMASPALFGSVAERTRAFGDHLARLVDLDAHRGGPVNDLLRAFLALERGRVDNAAALRQAAEEGRAPARPQRWSSGKIKRGRPALPPYTFMVQLPCSPAVLEVALGRVGPEDAWLQIDAGRLSFDRVRTVARAEPSPVTVVARGVVRGFATTLAGAGGVAPVIDVSHLTVELAGLQAARLSRFDGATATTDLPPQDAALARKLIEAGVLTLEG